MLIAENMPVRKVQTLTEIRRKLQRNEISSNTHEKCPLLIRCTFLWHPWFRGDQTSESPPWRLHLVSVVLTRAHFNHHLDSPQANVFARLLLLVSNATAIPAAVVAGLRENYTLGTQQPFHPVLQKISLSENEIAADGQVYLEIFVENLNFRITIFKDHTLSAMKDFTWWYVVVTSKSLDCALLANF